MTTPDQHLIDELVREVRAEPTSRNGHQGHYQRTETGFSDAQVIEMCRREKRDPEKFTRLFDEGDTSAYKGNASSADFALIGKFYFYTQDASQIESLMRQSALIRPKWDEGRAGKTWLRYSIDKAIDKARREGARTYTPATILKTAPEDSSLRDTRTLLGRAIKEGIPDPEELIDNVLLAHKVHIVYGPSGVGKSFLVLWAAMRLVEQGENVVIYDAENGKRIVSERLESMGADPEALDKHLYYYPHPTLDPDEVRELADDIKPALVVFDPLISFLVAEGIDENQPSEVEKWFSRYTSPLRSRDIAVLIMEHVPVEGGRIRAASRKRDHADFVWSAACSNPFNRDTMGSLTLLLDKDREGWLPQLIKFAVGAGEDGFVFQRTEGIVQVEDPETGLTQKQQHSLMALEKFGAIGAKHAEWRREAEKLGVSFRTHARAIKKLLDNNLVLQEKDRYYALGATQCHPSAMAPNGTDLPGGATCR